MRAGLAVCHCEPLEDLNSFSPHTAGVVLLECLEFHISTPEHRKAIKQIEWITSARKRFPAGEWHFWLSHNLAPLTLHRQLIKKIIKLLLLLTLNVRMCLLTAESAVSRASRLKRIALPKTIQIFRSVRANITIIVTMVAFIKRTAN